MKINEKILYIRAVLDLTQEELAKEFNVDANTICRWEKENRNPSRKHQLMIDLFAKKHNIEFPNKVK